MLSASEAKRLAHRALALTKADTCTVSLSGQDRGHVRFALNSATTSGRQADTVLSVESSFGRRSGSASTNALDDESIAAAVRQSEEIARLAPDDPEFLPPLGPQRYLKSRAWFGSAAGATPEKVAALCQPVIAEATAREVTAAGFLEAGGRFAALATHNGLFVHEQITNANFTVTARTGDGTGSGWAGTSENDIARLDTRALGATAVRKALASRSPLTLEPGKYTVILEPSAVCDLLSILIGQFDARSADEGRSFLSGKGGQAKVGERLFGEQVTLLSDPQDPLAPGPVCGGEGLPARRRLWVENGVVRTLYCPRFWAQKTGREPVPYPTNLIMPGGRTTLEEMLRDTKRGVLVTRFWYIREVDPRTVLLTGLTRDGTFLIENGAISRPIRNFRFNESPVAMLNHVVAMGPSQRTTGSEMTDWPICVPPLLIKDFTFSSLSEAV